MQEEKFPVNEVHETRGQLFVKPIKEEISKIWKMDSNCTWKTMPIMKQKHYSNHRTSSWDTKLMALSWRNYWNAAQLDWYYHMGLNGDYQVQEGRWLFQQSFWKGRILCICTYNFPQWMLNYIIYESVTHQVLNGCMILFHAHSRE